MPRVLVFNSTLLPLSETFVAAHIVGMRRYDVVVAAYNRVAGIDLPVGLPTVVRDDFARAPNGELRSLRARDAAFLSALRAFKPDVVHAHFAWGGSRFLRFAEKLGVPFLTTLHGSDVTRPVGLFHGGIGALRFELARRWLFLRGTRFLAVSNYIRDRALRLGAPSDRTVVHYLGIDIERCARQRVVPAIPTVLFVGRINEGKGLHNLIEAMAGVQLQIPDARLRVVGEGLLRASCEERASRMLTGTSFLGGLPHPRVLDEMAGATVLVLPSIETEKFPGEGAPTVVMEAAAAGVPVVATRQGGTAELIEDCVTGLLASPNDADSLAGQIVRILTSPDLAESLARGAARLVRQKFDGSQQNARLENLYDQLLGIDIRPDRASPSPELID